MENREDKLKELLQDGIQLFLVSDGGAIDGLQYYGWVIGTHMDVLVKHKGHAPGNPDLIESLQTESVGALTTIKRVRWCQMHITLNLTSTLSANYDIQAQIEQVLNMMKVYCDLDQWSIHHMKGYQEDKDLEHKAQLNNL
eukprot:14203919-Ditylum_brightwellii.AAC.1